MFICPKIHSLVPRFENMSSSHRNNRLLQATFGHNSGWLSTFQLFMDITLATCQKTFISDAITFFKWSCQLFSDRLTTPQLLFGDFNCDPFDHPEFVAFSELGFKDVAQHFAT
jgi:hypothetical protein